jgi:hypothetical protein
MHQGGNSGIRGRDLKEQLCLRKEGTADSILRKTVELKVMKQIVGTSIRLQKVSYWTLWRGTLQNERTA